MYLTNEKKLNFRINGLFYTRKWNDYVNYVYFENVFGGKSLLKNINKKSEELGLIFNSSMVNESEEKKWLDSGWSKKHSLLVCESYLKDVHGESLKPNKSIKTQEVSYVRYSGVNQGRWEDFRTLLEKFLFKFY